MSEQNNREVTRRRMLGMTAAVGAGLGLAHMAAQGFAAETAPPAKPGQRTAMGLKHSPLEKVRIGFIGVGGRGSSLLNDLLNIDKAQVTAVCDIVPERVQRAQDRIVKAGNAKPAGHTAGERDFESLCKRDDVDLVYIATPWEWHAPMAVCAMRNGKHAAVEVPAALTLEDCWQLVDTAEQTQRHCMMLENCCYGETEMLVLNMARQGIFGELTHAEAAYIHCANGYLLTQDSSAVWRRRYWNRLNGNLYPTHGLGPVSQYLGIHHGDRFAHLVSMSSPERTFSMLRDQLPAGDPVKTEKFACGDVNTTLIQTALGRSIMVQFDTATPRPYTRINMICGTNGAFCDYPPRIHLRGKADVWETDMAPYMQRYGHPLWTKLKTMALKTGGHGGMDFVMSWRLIQCLLEGSPLDMSVYDAAAWSSIFPLSIASVARGSAPVEIPDFTRGHWTAAAQ